MISMTGKMKRIRQLLDMEELTKEEVKELKMLMKHTTAEEFFGEQEKPALGFKTGTQIISEEGSYARILLEYIEEKDPEGYQMMIGLNKMQAFVHQRVEEFMTEMFRQEELYIDSHKTENMPFQDYLSLCYHASSYAQEKAMEVLLQLPGLI